MLKRKLGRVFFNTVPSFNQDIYDFCVRYVDRFNGDNDSNPESNGEYFFLATHVPKLGVIFDVGANIGDWAKFVLDISPRSTIHCFEPSKTTFSELENRNWPTNVLLNNIGCGDINGMAELNIFAEGSGLNSIYFRRGIEHAKVSNIEIIEIITLDGYCDRNNITQIDYLKVDVEGHELMVFRGLSRMLEHGCVRIIQFEYGGCNLDARVYLRDIFDFLSPYGFHFYKLYPKSARHIKKYQHNLETFKYSNWIAALDNTL